MKYHVFVCITNDMVFLIILNSLAICRICRIFSSFMLMIQIKCAALHLTQFIIEYKNGKFKLYKGSISREGHYE